MAMRPKEGIPCWNSEISVCSTLLGLCSAKGARDGPCSSLRTLLARSNRGGVTLEASVPVMMSQNSQDCGLDKYFSRTEATVHGARVDRTDSHAFLYLMAIHSSASFEGRPEKM